MWMAIRLSPWRDDWQAPLVAIGSAITPTMTWQPGRVLLLDVERSLAWLGGLRCLKKRVQTEIANLGLAADITIARGSKAAWLLTLARPSGSGWRYALSWRRVAQQLDPLPLSLLPSAKPHVVWLHRLGIEQLSHLRALQRSELVARTHPALLTELDQAYGHVIWPLTPIELPLQFEAKKALPRRIEQAQALEPWLRQLLSQLCHWLRQHHLAVSRLECRLLHHDRRRAWRPTVLMLALREPSNQIETLWRWLATRLERTQLPAPVSDIWLLSRMLVGNQPVNRTLFDDLLAPESLNSTLDLLRARLGDAGVLQVQPQADYRVEKVNDWTSEPIAGALAHPPPMGSHCPAWILAAPQALATRGGQPRLKGPLRLLHGPYRIETGWWDDRPVCRDYFVASDHDARRYWIYRERDNAQARWFLQGLFG